MTDYRIAVRQARRSYAQNSLPPVRDTTIVRPFASVKRVGVMTHYRIGRFGGSFYRSRRKTNYQIEAEWFAAAALFGVAISIVVGMAFLIYHGKYPII